VPFARLSLLGHNASHVPFTRVIDHQPFLVLLDDQRSDEPRQLASFKEVGGVPRPAGTTARDQVQMGARERLVHEYAARFQQIGERAEQGTIEKADADDGVEHLGAEGQRIGIRYDAEDALVSSYRGRDRTLGEVHNDDGASEARDGFGVAASSCRKVENESVRRQTGAVINDPTRRTVVGLPESLAVPRVPLIALAARIVTRAH